MPAGRLYAPGKRYKLKVKKRRSTRRPRKTQTAIVKKNTKDIKLLKQVGYQYAPFVLKQSGALSNTRHASLITAPNLWSGIYRMHGVSNEDLPRQYNLKSINLDWICQCESNAVGNLWFQVMLVGVKNKMGAQVLERTTRLSDLEENLDYTSCSAGTTFALQGDWGYKLNPQLYTVYYNSGQRRIGEATMTAGTAVTNIRDSTAHGSATIKFRRTFKNDETSSSGFKELTYAQLEPREHLYFMIFSNSSGGVISEGELFHSMRCQFNGHCNNPN